MYEMYQNHTFLIFEFMYLCNPNIQKEEMYDSSYISYIGNFRESVNFKLTIFDSNILAPSVETAVGSSSRLNLTAGTGSHP